MAVLMAAGVSLIECSEIYLMVFDEVQGGVRFLFSF